MMIKRTARVAIVLLCNMLLLTACEKESGHVAVRATTTSTSSMTLQVDGISKTATSSIATVYTGLGSLQIIAQIGSGSEIVNISVDRFAVGAFDVVKNSAILSYGTSSTYADTYLANTGTITITTYSSDTVAGTFQFTGTNTTTATATKVITNGVFSCKYVKI